MAILAAGCATSSIHHSGQFKDPTGASRLWVLLPVQNLTETPQAGERVEAILDSVLRAYGIVHLAHYSGAQETNALPEIDERRRFEQALTWARVHKYMYAVTGSVEEWRYRYGTDGEPAVGISLQLLDVDSGRVLWSSSGARSGWGRETLDIIGNCDFLALSC
jgi:hypothetical protein